MKLIAVIAGWAADYGATMLVSAGIGLLLALAIGMRTAGSGAMPAPEQLEKEVLALAFTTPVLLVSMFLGGLATVLGGFVAAAVAGRDEIWHALATGTLVLLTGLLLISGEYAAGGTTAPLWCSITGTVVTLPCALLGGWLKTLIRRRHKP